MGNKWELFDQVEPQGSIKINNVPDGTKIVVVSDFQVPLEDRRLLATVFEDFVPWFLGGSPESHIFINGDGLDLFKLSKFLHRVVPKFTTGDEIAIMEWYLDTIGRHFTNRHYVFGNHEARWDRHIMEQAPELAPFTRTLAEALNLDDHEWDYVPYLKHYAFQGFIITHGDTTVKHAAARMLESYHTSGVSGHVNRPQSYTFANASGDDPITWYCSGMMCRMDIGDIIKDWAKIQPWQQGFLIGEVRDGILHVEPIRVHHDAFRAAGRVFPLRKEGYDPAISA